MNLFADFVRRVIAPIGRARPMPARHGRPADLSRVAVEPPRDAAHGDIATNAAMVLAKPPGSSRARSPKRSLTRLQHDPDVAVGRGRRPRLHQSQARRGFWRGALGRI